MMDDLYTYLKEGKYEKDDVRTEDRPVSDGGTEKTGESDRPGGSTEVEPGQLSMDDADADGHQGGTKGGVRSDRDEHGGGDVAGYVDREQQAKPSRDADGSREDHTLTQARYKPKSKGQDFGQLIPKSMKEQIEKALDKLEKEVGNIDEYVKNKLGYKSLDELYDSFHAGQIDALALALYNIDVKIQHHKDR